MKGFYVAQEAHVVNILPPVDANGGVNSDVFDMKNYGHVSIIIQVGVSAGTAPTVTVTQCDDFTPSNEAAITFDCYKEETALGDQLGAKVAETTSGFVISTNNTIFYVIEIDAQQLSDGFGKLRVKFTNTSASTIVSAVAILSGARYGADQSATAIA